MSTDDPSTVGASRGRGNSTQTGAAFIHPSEDPRVIAGQGTVCLEFLEQLEQEHSLSSLDAVIIPVGGGGLASGNIITLRHFLGDKVKVRA